MYMGHHDCRRYIGKHPTKSALTTLGALKNDPQAGLIVAAARAETLYASFLTSNNVKPTTGEVCPIRLLGCHCKGPRCVCKSSPIREVLDHGELFMNGRRAFVYVAHPYYLNGDHIEALDCFCADYGLTALITAGSWYFHGATLRIELRRRSE